MHLEPRREEAPHRTLPVPCANPDAVALWDDVRNCLGIARLLVQDGRPVAMVATACRLAVELGCRAALEQAERPFDGSLEVSLAATPLAGLMEQAAAASEPLSAAERTLGRVAAWLRGLAPERSWGF